jgi:Protein of unknown function (DUF4236)
MGYVRLFRRVRVAPGLTLNLSKSGPSLSVGVRGAHVTVGRSGVRRTVGIPGTGVFYTTHDGWHSGIHTARPFHDAAPRLSGRQQLAHDVFLVMLALLLLMVIMAVLAAITGL